jgi:hypothetical protein
MITRYVPELVVLQELNWVQLLNKNPRENLESRQLKRKNSKTYTTKWKNQFLLDKATFLKRLTKQKP